MDLTEEELAQAVADLPAEGAELVCPECGRPFGSPAALNGHLAAHRGKAKGRAEASRERGKNKPPPSGGLESSGRTVVNKAIANVQTVAGFAAMFAPHVGLTIAGLRDPQTQKWIVRSRAEIAGGILLGHIAGARTPDEIQRAAQILQLLSRFNSIFEASALGDVVGSIAVAAAVDARIIPVDFKVKVGQLELPIVTATIGDVVAELEAQGLYDAPPPEQAPPAPSGSSNGPAGAELVSGGVEAT